MPPALATELAVRAWPFRLWALATSILAFSLVAVAALYGPPSLVRTAAILAGPAVGLPWAVLCLASWFHPLNGTMAPNARLFGRLPIWLQSVARWYASVFLVAFALFCCFAWPAFALSNLWHLAQ